MANQDTTNDYLLEEIRLNRTAIQEIGKVMSGKVGRAELFGWIAASATLMGIMFRVTGI